MPESAPGLFASWSSRLVRINWIAFVLALLLLFSLGVPAGAQNPHPQAPPRFVVVLDAAHGGSDAGARIVDAPGKQVKEKDLTLALSVKLRSLLGARGISVVTTRESDTDLDPGQRAEIANHAKAQACLTLHAAMSGSGIHLFISSLPPSRPAQFLPWKTAQAAFVTRSVALAGVVNSTLLHAGLTVTLGRTALTTVDSMACPAIAIEIAPQAAPNHGSGPGASVDDPGYQAQVTQALAAAMVAWRAEARQP
jgi:N-acetylmuramoyl-L-alanine amidase